MVIHRHTWLYTSIHSDTEPYMAIHSHVLLYTGIIGDTQPYMAITQLYMAVHNYT